MSVIFRICGAVNEFEVLDGSSNVLLFFPIGCVCVLSD